LKTYGCLYIVATPIGNLGDITLRALEVLKSVALIAAEDTRHSQRLLNHYNIKTPLISLHQFNEEKRVHELQKRMQQKQDIALISDAGTPLISDPGYRLVHHLVSQGLKVVPIPGPCALIAALSASGLPTDRFVFEGFLPAKGSERRKRLQMLEYEPRTIIFYEAPHRILNLIDLVIEVFGELRVGAIMRELTKTFETAHYGTFFELKQHITEDDHQQLGEFVVLIEGISRSEEGQDLDEYKRVLKILLSEVPLKQAVAIATEITKGPRKLLYQLALKMKDNLRDF
jgi:16S rRNA (cytidine1402-2'-O)-methyltransferase